MEKIMPTAINLYKTDGYLEIAWNDGQVCKYPLSQLREACPCVECRGGHQYMGREFGPTDILKLTPKRSYMVTALAMVGNYALQPSWDDGHQTGIYTWDYLKHLCPDEEK
jgi:DUF971 family protein